MLKEKRLKPNMTVSFAFEDLQTLVSDAIFLRRLTFIPEAMMIPKAAVLFSTYVQKVSCLGEMCSIGT